MLGHGPATTISTDAAAGSRELGVRTPVGEPDKHMYPRLHTFAESTRCMSDAPVHLCKSYSCIWWHVKQVGLKTCEPVCAHSQGDCLTRSLTAKARVARSLRAGQSCRFQMLQILCYIQTYIQMLCSMSSCAEPLLFAGQQALPLALP